MAIRMTGLNSGLDTEAIVEQLMESHKLKKTKVENKKTKLEWKQEKWKDLNTKLYKLYTGSLSKVKLQGNYNQKTATSSNEKAVTVTADNGAPTGTNSVKVKELASSQYVTGGQTTGITRDTKLKDLGMSGQITFTSKAGTENPKEEILTIDDETTVGSFLEAAKKAGLSANFDEKQGRFFISSSESGVENKFTITSDQTIDGASSLTKLGLDNIDGSKRGGGTDLTVVAANDAKIELNGATITGSSNSIKANGMTFTLNGLTADDETVTVGVTTDTTKVYNMVKDFVKEYNEILKEMNTLYNADSSRGYDPLTDDQKDEMSDDEIEKWENKIKDSLLRRDSTLESLISTMRNDMQKGFTASSGKTYSLASFGISTSTDYTEKGLLHIKGDEDDTIYASENNLLKAALEDNPEDVQEVLSKVFSGMYNDLQDKMKSTSLSSALTFYNDKEMKKQVDTYKTDIKDWETKLKNIEDKYYKQFSAMESAMAKLNSQSSYLSGLFGSM
ncbi:MAG: flagellar filament capping protein FliD [Lachnospiraceae bacterium]|nr:flagellar filament capping protein FliD [Lachnospiraceae bacterium]